MAKSTFRRSAVVVSIVCVLGIVFSAALLEATGGTADHVVGQMDFTKNAANFVDGRGLNFPSAVAVDPVGGEVYVADTDNNRVLGWKSASEFQGNQPADIVIGQPDFNSYYCNQTVGALSPGNSTPAQNTLCNPEGVAVDDSGNVYVSDTGNNRVLVYPNPFASLPGQDSNFDAIAAFGQGSGGNSFTTNTAATGQTGLDTPQGIAVDASGNLFVLDADNNRALEYFDPLGAADPTTGAGDVVADRVFGQTDFSGNQENQGLASSNNATLSTYGATIDGLATDSYGDIYVTDFNNRRVLEYNGPFGSVGNDPAANLVFWQVGFQPSGITVDPSNTVYIASYGAVYEFAETSNPPSNVASTSWVTSPPNTAVLTSNLGLAADESDDLFIADAANNREIEYLHGSTTPSAVEGQPNYINRIANFVNARGLGAPGAVAIDETSTPNHIYVLDQANNRVLGWKSLAEFTGNQPADLVIGQPDFFSTGCNGWTPSTNGTPSAQTLCLYAHSIYAVTGGGIAVDRYGNLFVADVGNNRVLEFDDPFTQLQNTGQDANFTATTVFGQGGSFSSTSCNRGSGTSSSTLCWPTGVTFDPAGNLYVADAGNNRVLQFKPDTSGSFAASYYNPSAVFGQSGSFSSATCANGLNGNPPPAANTLCGEATDASLGITDDYLGVTSDADGNLYIADFENNRVLEFTPSTPGNFGADPAANLVFGQGSSGTDFISNFCDGNSTGTAISASSLCLPVGLTTDPSGNLYIADGNSRVLEYDEATQPPANVTADRVFGQSDFTHSGCNDGNTNRSAGAASLCFQNDLNENGGFSQVAQLATDALGHLYVADTGNNRVMEFDSPLSEPTPTSTPTPTPSPTPIPTPTPSPTATPSPTPSPAPSPTPTATPSPTPTPVSKWLHFGPNPVIFPNTVFGVTGATSSPVQVHLRNPDTQSKKSITLEGMKFVGLDAGDFTVASSTCPEVIPDGSKCFVSLTFTPSALGLRRARLKVFDNAGNAPQVFHLKGYGVRGKLHRSTKAIYFGHILKDQVSPAHDLILTNPNTVPLKIGKVAVFTTSTAKVNQFAKVADGCANTQLAAGAQCTISVTFNPRHRGIITGDIRIHDDARHRPQNVYLQGTGE